MKSCDFNHWGANVEHMEYKIIFIYTYGNELDNFGKLRFEGGYNMTDEEKRELYFANSVLRVISGYDNDMYNDMLREWNKVQKPTRTEGGHARTETLWMNYEIENGQISLTI